MSEPWHVGMIVGSNRRESINRKLANAIAAIGTPTLSFEDIRIDDLPMYNGDLEGSRPVTVDRFTQHVANCDAVLVVMPEHNRSLPAVLKNAIDWGSKPADRNVWRDKPVMITGTSPGAIGTAVGQQHLRQILGILGSVVMGGEAYIAFKPTLLDEHGAIADAGTLTFLRGHLERFAALVGKLSPAAMPTAVKAAVV